MFDEQALYDHGLAGLQLKRFLLVTLEEETALPRMAGHAIASGTIG